MLNKLPRLGRTFYISLVSVVLGVSCAFYLQADSENILVNIDSEKMATIMPVKDVSSSISGIAPVSDLVEGLRLRVKKEPNDMEGWVLLGKSYHYLQQLDKANAAFRKAKALGYKGEIPFTVMYRDISLLKTPPVYNDYISNLITQPLDQDRVKTEQIAQGDS